MSGAPLLTVEDLTVHFKIRRGLTRKSIDVVHAADDIGFALEKGTTLALVGESGSGKTTVAQAVLGLNRAGGRPHRVPRQGRAEAAAARAAGRSATACRSSSRIPTPVSTRA